jgi:hypothetical protein
MDGEHQDVGTSLEILVRGVELCPVNRFQRWREKNGAFNREDPMGDLVRLR